MKRENWKEKMKLKDVVMVTRRRRKMKQFKDVLQTGRKIDVRNRTDRGMKIDEKNRILK